MANAGGAAEFRELVARHLGRVYHLCFRMTLRSDEAGAACYEAFQRAFLGQRAMGEARSEAQSEAKIALWLLKIAAHVIEQRIPATPEVSFDLLDETLRSEATRTEEVSSLVDPEREVLLWELKQGCMTAVVNCLSPGERMAFVMSAVLRLSDEEAALALGIKPSAFKVRLSRARKKIGDYLAPRCEHVDPRNPCHCPSRIGVAIRRGFIARPARAEVNLRRSLPRFDDGQHLHDAVAIYQTLPEPDPPIALRERIEQALASGAWARAAEGERAG